MLADMGLAISSGKYARDWFKWVKWVIEHTDGMGKQGALLTAFVACGQHELVAASLSDFVSHNVSISSAQSTLSALQYYLGLICHTIRPPSWRRS